MNLKQLSASGLKAHAVQAMAGLLLGVAATSALAQSPVSLQSLAEVERPVKQADGKVKLERQVAKNVPPGDVVMFTNTLKNISKKPADKLLLTNPVPADMEFKRAWGDKAVITFSVDGKQFDRLEKLSVTGADGKARPAQAADVTQVRWTLRESLPPGQSASVGYDAAVK